MKLGKNFDNLGEICGELMISAVSSWYLRWALQFLSYSSNAGLHIHCRDSLKRLDPSQYPHSSHVHCRDSPSLSWYLVQRLTKETQSLSVSPLQSWPLQRLPIPLMIFSAETHSLSSIISTRETHSPLSSPLQRLTLLSLIITTAETQYLSLLSSSLQRLTLFVTWHCRDSLSLSMIFTDTERIRAKNRKDSIYAGLQPA